MANPLQQIIAQQRERRKQEGGEEVVSLIKSFFNHASLYAGLVAYTAVGAGVSILRHIISTFIIEIIRFHYFSLMDIMSYLCIHFVHMGMWKFE